MLPFTTGYEPVATYGEAIQASAATNVNFHNLVVV